MQIGDDACWVVSSSICDPYIFLLLNVGDVLIIQIHHDTKTLTIVKILKVGKNITVFQNMT